MLTVGTWYVDRETRTRWRVLVIHAHTVEVINAHGMRVLHSRLIWETDLRTGTTVLSTKQPIH